MWRGITQSCFKLTVSSVGDRRNRGVQGALVPEVFCCLTMDMDESERKQKAGAGCGGPMRATKPIGCSQFHNPVQIALPILPPN